MANQQLEVHDLDPFEFMLLYRGLKKAHTGWLAVIAPISLGAIFLATSVSATMGTPRDFQFWADIRRVLRVAHTPASQPDFSLMRDVTSWLLLVIIVSGALLLHRQWQYMSLCLSGLARHGAITARAEPKENTFSRLLRINKIANRATAPQQPFDVLVKAVVESLRRRNGWLSGLTVLASIVLALLLVQ